MTIEEAHLDFKLKWDKVDNKFNRNFNDEEIDWLLHDAQMLFIRSRFNGSNVAKAKFEANSSRLHELTPLHIQFPTEPEITLNPTKLEPYLLSKVDTTLLSNKYLYLTSLSVYNNDCKKWVNPIFQSHDTYLEELANPFNVENGIFTMNGEDENTVIYIYGNVSKARISYLKHPNRVFKGTYLHPFITSTVPVQFSLPEHTHSIIVDIAVDICKGINTTNYDQKQLPNTLS